jgi:hypothetical protein
MLVLLAIIHSFIISMLGDRVKRSYCIPIRQSDVVGRMSGYLVTLCSRKIKFWTKCSMFSETFTFHTVRMRQSPNLLENQVVCDILSVNKSIVLFSHLSFFANPKASVFLISQKENVQFWRLSNLFKHRLVFF